MLLRFIWCRSLALMRVQSELTVIEMHTDAEKKFAKFYSSFKYKQKLNMSLYYPYLKGLNFFLSHFSNVRALRDFNTL